MDPEVESFWHAYALRRLKRFKRTRGKRYDVEFACPNGDAWARPWQSCSFPWERIKQDDDPRDRFPQFGLLCYESLADALAAVLSSPLMDEDTALNRSRLNLFPVPTKGKDYTKIRERALRHVREKGVSCEELVDAVNRHTPDAKRLAKFRKSGDGQLLGRERELAFMAMGLFVDDTGGVPKEFIEILHAVLRNDAHEHSDVLRAAIWALGRANRKSSIAELVAFLHRTGEGLSFSAGTALQMLCSSYRMIPLPTADSAVYWEKEWEKGADLTPMEWQAKDCKSVFWETRLRAVFAADRKQIDMLRDDEIWVVSNAANSIDLVEIRLTDDLIRAIRMQSAELCARTTESSGVSAVNVAMRCGANGAIRASEDFVRALAKIIAREDEIEQDLKRSNRKDCSSPQLAGAPRR